MVNRSEREVVKEKSQREREREKEVMIIIRMNFPELL
jgi:hypothetical protein